MSLYNINKFTGKEAKIVLKIVRNHIEALYKCLNDTYSLVKSIKKGEKANTALVSEYEAIINTLKNANTLLTVPPECESIELEWENQVLLKEIRVVDATKEHLKQLRGNDEDVIEVDILKNEVHSLNEKMIQKTNELERNWIDLNNATISNSQYKTELENEKSLVAHFRK